LINLLQLKNTYDTLFDFCEAENFSGYDPFDGLNSGIFQALPLKYFAFARIIFLQLVKRSPVNLRPLLLIKKGTNPKGIALFALSELSRFRATGDAIHAKNAQELLERLLELKTIYKNRTTFGYNFDWQSRAFFAPKGTPTIVPTAFASQALTEGYELLGSEIYLDAAKEICEFITHDLNRIGESEDEICFSYTPLDRSGIFNASLLAGECLAKIGANCGNEQYLKLAKKSAIYVIQRQKENGSWAYGSRLRHAWVDNFHTAYILLSLFRLQKLIPNFECQDSIKKGLDFWLDNFFLADGTPKYYDNSTFPIDIHSASAAIVALCELKELDGRCLPLAEKVASWTIENLRDEQGFFYYQKRKFSTIKTPFIRWSNAWTAFALSKLLEQKSKS
jgi:uncharacterized protein YyaL (SSP411 family)